MVALSRRQNRRDRSIETKPAWVTELADVPDLKSGVFCVFNNIRVLPKSTENIVQTHDWLWSLTDAAPSSSNPASLARCYLLRCHLSARVNWNRKIG